MYRKLRLGDWSPEHDKLLKDMARENTPTRVIAAKLNRTENSVRSRARRIKLSLKAANRANI